MRLNAAASMLTIAAISTIACAAAQPAKVALSPPYLPFPNYPGRVSYQRVATFAEQGPFSRYMITFLTPDPEESVLAWYRGTLRQYQFRINTSTQSSLLSARNRRATVLVSVNRTRTPGYQTEVYLSYQRFPDK